MLFYKTWMDLALDSCFLLEAILDSPLCSWRGCLQLHEAIIQFLFLLQRTPLALSSCWQTRGDGEPDLYGCTKSKVLACKSPGSGPLCQHSIAGGWPPKPVYNRSFCAWEMHIVMIRI